MKSHVVTIVMKILIIRALSRFFFFCTVLPLTKLKLALKGALLRGFCFVQVNSVLKSLLSIFTHITYIFTARYQVNFAAFRSIPGCAKIIAQYLYSYYIIKAHCKVNFAAFRSILC